MIKHAILFLTVLTLPLAGQTREKICLNGIWKFSPGTLQQDVLSKDAQWFDFPVPSYWDATEEFGIQAPWPKDLSRGWYRRTFTMNSTWNGKQIFIRFDAVRAMCEVFINGKSVGKNDDGFLPFRFDITNLVHRDQPNEILVKVTNWRGWLAKDAQGIQLPVGQLITGANALLAPIGPPMRNGNYAGIWQDVWLEALPAIHLENIKIVTSVAEKRITVQTRLNQPSGLQVKHEILDQNQTILTLGPVPAEKDISTSWPGAKFWWPHDPYLYRMKTSLLHPDGTVVDQVVTRFGFREIQIHGRDIFLNSQRIILLADQWMQTGDPAGLIALRYEYAKAFFQLLKRCNINTVRLHGLPSPPSTLDAADETGMLILDESANYGSDGHMRLTDPLYQKRNLAHIRRWIERDWNHPAVIAWSLGNEYVPPENHRRDLYQTAKTLDPTRIAYVDCGAEPADVLCPHYAWHWARSYQLPNTAYWFADPVAAKQILGQSPAERKKPWFMGEFLETHTIVTSGAASVFLGPKFPAATDNEKRAIQYYALRMVAEGARYTGLAEMNPFTLVHDTWHYCSQGQTLRWPDPAAPGIKPVKLGGLKVNPGLVPGDSFAWSKMHDDIRFAYSPMYVYPKEYSHTFRGGTSTRKRIVCLNGDLRDIPKIVKWSLEIDKKIVKAGTHSVTCPIGYPEEFDIDLPLPQVSARTEGVLILGVEMEGKNVFENPVKIALFPPPVSSTPLNQVGFWQISNMEREILNALKITGREISQTDSLAGIKVLILGDNTTGQNKHKATYEKIARFVAAGGCAIALPQSTRRATWMPGLIKQDAESWSTIGFSTKPHPALSGLTDQDLCFWKNNNIISKNNFRLNELPKQASPLVVAGSSNGLIHALLVEYPYGKGLYLLCQMPVLENADREAAAGALLRNMVNFGLNLKPANAPAPPPFTYISSWETDLWPEEVLPSKVKDGFRISQLSYNCGSDKLVLEALKMGCFAEWKIKGIPNGLKEAELAVRLRVGDGGHVLKNSFKYQIEIDNKPVLMKTDYDDVGMTYDSFQGWKIIMGTWKTPRPIALRNGSRIRITARQDWSAVVSITLFGKGPE